MKYKRFKIFALCLCLANWLPLVEQFPLKFQIHEPMAMSITAIEARCHEHQQKPSLHIILRMKKQNFHGSLVWSFRLTNQIAHL